MLICFSKDLFILGFIICITSVISFFFNKSKKEYEQNLIKYNQSLISYNLKTKQYQKDILKYNELIGISISKYYDYQRKELVSKELKKTTLPTFEVDYKKGYSHDFFKVFLKNYFGKFIKENACIKNFGYYSLDYSPYITDFAFIDEIEKLCIAIEIDEPYTLIDKKPIHIDDELRNSFFIKKNWIIIRFAEEQIVKYPEYCCKTIADTINILSNKYVFDKILANSSELPKISRWTNKDVNELIKIRYRENYLSKVKDPFQYQKEIESIMNKAFGGFQNKIN